MNDQLRVPAPASEMSDAQKIQELAAIARKAIGHMQNRGCATIKYRMMARINALTGNARDFYKQQESYDPPDIPLTSEV